jgi:hypothetical protein
MVLNVPQDTTITISIEGVHDQSAYIDYVRLFRKLDYPVFTVIIDRSGSAQHEDVLHLEPGTSDPDQGIPDYDKASYHNKSFFAGQKILGYFNTYTELLNLVRPLGVKAYIEYVDRDE